MKSHVCRCSFALLVLLVGVKFGTTAGVGPTTRNDFLFLSYAQQHSPVSQHRAGECHCSKCPEAARKGRNAACWF